MDMNEDKNPAPVDEPTETSQPEETENSDAKKIEELEAQYQQMREIAARAQADGINYRNWAEREMKRLKAYGSERAILAMLPVWDNLERALATSEADPSTIREGVRMVRAQFSDALKNLGVSELDPTGQPFSPAEHDATGMVPVTDQSQDGLIQTVVRKGFMLSDKVIRPAMVVVGRYTAPEPEKEAEKNDDKESTD